MTYDPDLPTPIGIIYKEEKETYDSLSAEMPSG